MASIATITSSAERVTCVAGSTTTCAFTVTNTSGRALRVGARPLARDPAQQDWLSLDGEVERGLGSGVTDQFTVQAQVPADAPPGRYGLRLLVFSTGHPDEDFTEGPEVTVEVTPSAAPHEAAPPRGFPWWIVVVAALVLAIIGGLTAWLLWPDKGEAPEAPAQPASVEVPRVDLTGRWASNDGGSYYLRQDGDALYWYGERAVSGPPWSNVFEGKASGDTIRGTWADVPKGKAMGQGTLELRILDGGKSLERTGVTGGFGGSRWTRQ